MHRRGRTPLGRPLEQVLLAADELKSVAVHLCELFHCQPVSLLILIDS